MPHRPSAPLARRVRRALAAALALPLALGAGARSARGEVVRVEVARRVTVQGADGARWERVEGRLHYAWNPAAPANRRIVDLARAPRDASGRVTAWSDFVLLRPLAGGGVTPSGVTVVDVVNRGGITTGVFALGAQRGASVDSAAAYGDAVLLRRGHAILAVGWQWDVPAETPGLHFGAPVACATVAPRAAAPDASPCARSLTGRVRSDITVDAPTRVIPLGHRVGASQAVGYPVADLREPTAVLTVRDGPRAPRTVIPRDRWRFAREDASGAVVDDARHAYLADGFQAGKIYEVVYTARDPFVVGAGLLAIRDAMAWAKHDATSLVATRTGLAYGVSQTGRFLRHFLWEGLNVDERGRPVYDGLFAHTAGAGRGSFNHRFAQPSRDAQPYSTFDYPTDVFPFASVDVVDPATGRRAGLRTRAPMPAAARPKVFYVDGGYEYWGRAASLTHTTPDGARDVPLASDERRYFLASAQHSGPGAWPPPEGARIEGSPAWRGDPLDQRLALRALVVALADWARDGTAPPPSAYPTRRAGTLVPVDSLARPAIPGVRLAMVPVTPVRLDFGPRWAAQGIVDAEPPRAGAPYRTLVPQVDSVGNDRDGIRSVELRVPLATYFPWQLRAPSLAGSDRLVSFGGTFVPLPKDEAARAASGDPRASIVARYGTREAFLAAVDRATTALVAERALLPDDVAAARTRMAATWDWIMAR